MSTQSKYSPFPTPVLVLVSLLLAAVAYYPGLGGEFQFDDTWNITANEDIHISDLNSSTLLSAAASGSSGPTGRPLSMLSFAFNYYFSGLQPFAYKLTNLLIHLLSGLLVYILVTKLLCAVNERQPQRLSENLMKVCGLVVATIWLLHPINLTTVLYVVQRMTGLATLFTLLAMLSYASGRVHQTKGERGSWQILMSITLFMPLAVLSKEIGALIPLYLFLMEAYIFRFYAPEQTVKHRLQALFGLILFIPAVVIAFYLVLNPGFITGSYAIRNFDLIERLLTESRILVRYISFILLPTNARLGLFHDDIDISENVLTPISTIWSLFGTFALIATAALLRKKLPLLSFGILFFFTGHLIESTFLGLELMHEHRNYLPQLGIILPLVYYAIVLPNKETGRKISYLLLAFFTLYLFSTTLMRSDTWGNNITFSITEVKHHPNSPRANYQAGRLYASLAERQKNHGQRTQYIQEAEHYFLKSAALDPSYLDGLFGLVVLYSSSGNSVPEVVKTQLITGLKNHVFRVNNYNQIKNLEKCISRGYCQLEQMVMQSLIAAAINNPRTPEKYRRLLK